ncbi:hypothetical protein VNO77_02838 [Canavalia gladiata]|uniref:Uncharacterized protein n=1 Tax=Canavalia gladiata TaxID=3824 RepID=A0AAN9MYP0_CANGL
MTNDKALVRPLAACETIGPAITNLCMQFYRGISLTSSIFIGTYGSFMDQFTRCRPKSIHQCVVPHTSDQPIRNCVFLFPVFLLYYTVNLDYYFNKIRLRTLGLARGKLLTFPKGDLMLEVLPENYELAWFCRVVPDLLKQKKASISFADLW